MNLVAKLDISIYYLLMLYALASSISIAVGNIAISLASLLAVVRYWNKPIAMIFDKGLVTAMAMFLGTVFISALFAYRPSIGFDNLWASLYRMFPLFLAIAFIKTQEKLRRIIIIMASSLLIADAYAIWQGLHGNDRAAAFSGHYMMFAGYLIQMIPLLVVIGLGKNALGIKIKAYFLSTAFISCIALLYNGTRGAWLAVVVALLVYSVFAIKENKKIGIGILAVCLIGGSLAINIPVVKERVQSIASYRSSSDDRTALWTSSWHMFQDHPLVGVGPGNFPVVYVPRYILPQAKEPHLVHAHNNFIHMLAETGIVGEVAFIYLFGYLLRVMYSRYMLYPRDIWALIPFLVTISLLTQGLTEYNFGNSTVIRMYWFIIGLSYVGARLEREQSRK